MAALSVLFLTVLLSSLPPLYSGDGVPSPIPGHLKPLGSHMDPVMVPRLLHALSPVEFHEKFVKEGRPVVMEGVMTGTEVLSNWQSDEYLRTKFGDDEMNVEQGKKENRSEGGYTMSMAEFLDRYQQEDLYMVSVLSEGMKREWLLPKFLLCGGYTNYLMYVYLWFSSGGTKSVVHKDTFENLHCLVSGRKEFVLIEPKYSTDIGPELEEMGFYTIDVDRVNMTEYPGLADVPWHLAVVNAGDCLFLPYAWIHHVRSFGRNFGINIWWTPFQFKEDQCVGDIPDFLPLGDFEVVPELQIKYVLIEEAREDGTIHVEDFHKMLNQNPQTVGMELLPVRKMFDLLKPGCNGFLTTSELDSVPVENYKTAYMFMAEVHEELVLSRTEGKAQPSHEHDHVHDQGSHGRESLHTDEADTQHSHQHTSMHDQSHSSHGHRDSHDAHTTLDEGDYDYFWPWDADGDGFGGFSYLDYDYDDPEMEEGGGRPPVHDRDEL